MIDKQFMIVFWKWVNCRIWESYSNVVNGNLYENSQQDSTVKYESYKQIQLQQTLIHPTASGRKFSKD
jgi:hypothetical protein